jgi:hypothetical protein
LIGLAEIKAHPVPKKSKNPEKNNGLADDSIASAAPSVSKPKAAKRKAPAKKAVKKSVKPARQKTAQANAPGSASAPGEPSIEAISLRAYFIAEKRSQLSLPPDADADWLEAKRQLMEESGSQ